MYRSLFVALLALVPAVALAAEPAKPKVKAIPDITYATIEKEKLKLDLVVPTTPGPHPLVVCFHGGAWKMGSRKDLTRPTGLLSLFYSQPQEEGGLLQKFAEKGFAAASVSYRLAPKAKFPAQIVDAKTAVRFLRSNADKYDLDPDRIAALGFSSGGHLATLLGTTDSDAGFDGDLLPGVSSKVSCVVDFFGPTDLRLYKESPGVERAFMVPLFGEKCLTDDAPYHQASPIDHVTKTTAPTLLIHGTADLIVPIIHSEQYYAKLKECGVAAELVKIKGKGHGWEDPAAVKQSSEAGLKFLTEHLMKDAKK